MLLYIEMLIFLSTSFLVLTEKGIAAEDVGKKGISDPMDIWKAWGSKYRSG